MTPTVTAQGKSLLPFLVCEVVDVTEEGTESMAGPSRTSFTTLPLEGDEPEKGKS